MIIQSNKVMVIGALIVPMCAVIIGLIAPVDASAACVLGLYDITNGAACAQGTGTNGVLFGPTGVFTSIVNTALFVIGAIAVLMLIYGGIRYTISGGDEKAITAAKNTILYAVVGIVVAVLAFAIINFVLASLMPGAATG